MGLTCGMVSNVRNKTRGSPKAAASFRYLHFKGKHFCQIRLLMVGRLGRDLLGVDGEIGWKKSERRKIFFYLFNIFVEASPPRRKVSKAEIFCHVYKLDIKCQSQKVPTLTFSSSEPELTFSRHSKLSLIKSTPTSLSTPVSKSLEAFPATAH